MLPGDFDLDDLTRRLRGRDPNAAAELVRHFEPEIRRVARIRLIRFRLGHLADSEDIAQSVFGRFLARLSDGEVEVVSAEKLLNLLAVIAANRVTSMARKERRQVRPTGGSEVTAVAHAESVPDRAPPVERAAVVRDLLEGVMADLGPDERELLQARLGGTEWAALAAARGEGADALRKRLTRALDGVAGRLGLEDAAVG